MIPWRRKHSRELSNERQIAHHERRLPADRFFWAVLDASVLQQRRISHRQLGYLFERVLPLPIERVHAVYGRWLDREGQTYVACGMERDALAKEIGDRVAQPLVRLCPVELPDFINDDSVEADSNAMSMNLLVREYEPRILQALRRRWILQIAAAIMLCGLLVTIGLQRRVAAIDARIRLANAARSDLIATAIGPAGGESSQPPELRLITELRTLRQTRQQPAENRDQLDATAVLADLLASWPRDLFVQADSIVVGTDIITIRGSASTSSEIQRLATGLQTPLQGRWLVNQPQINSGRDTVNAVIQLRSESMQHRDLARDAVGGSQ